MLESSPKMASLQKSHVVSNYIPKSKRFWLVVRSALDMRSRSPSTLGSLRHTWTLETFPCRVPSRVGASGGDFRPMAIFLGVVEERKTHAGPWKHSMEEPRPFTAVITSKPECRRARCTRSNEFYILASYLWRVAMRLSSLIKSSEEEPGTMPQPVSDLWLDCWECKWMLFSSFAPRAFNTLESSLYCFLFVLETDVRGEILAMGPAKAACGEGSFDGRKSVLDSVKSTTRTLSDTWKWLPSRSIFYHSSRTLRPSSSVHS